MDIQERESIIYACQELQKRLSMIDQTPLVMSAQDLLELLAHTYIYDTTIKPVPWETVVSATQNARKATYEPTDRNPLDTYRQILHRILRKISEQNYTTIRGIIVTALISTFKNKPNDAYARTIVLLYRACPMEELQ